MWNERNTVRVLQVGKNREILSLGGRGPKFVRFRVYKLQSHGQNNYYDSLDLQK